MRRRSILAAVACLEESISNDPIMLTEVNNMERKLLFIEYPACSTCKKAKNWLDEHGVAYTARHIKEENPTYEELKAWYQMSGLPLKKFFNTSGLLYKDMNLKDKLPTMSEEEQLKLLATNGMLVKRPLVVGKDFVLTGFREKEWEEKMGKLFDVF